jgi:hypothetical protein
MPTIADSLNAKPGRTGNTPRLTTLAALAWLEGQLGAGQDIATLPNSQRGNR